MAAVLSGRRAVVKQGYLRKFPSSTKGKFAAQIKKPEKRWYVFAVENRTRPVFETYQNEDAIITERPQHVLNLAHCKVVHSINLEKPEMFQILLKEKDLLFLAPSRLEKTEWETALKAKLIELGVLDTQEPEHIYTPSPCREERADGSRRPLPPEPVYSDPLPLSAQAHEDISQPSETRIEARAGSQSPPTPAPRLNVRLPETNNTENVNGIAKQEPEDTSYDSDFEDLSKLRVDLISVDLQQQVMESSVLHAPLEPQRSCPAAEVSENPLEMFDPLLQVPSNDSSSESNVEKTDVVQLLAYLEKQNIAIDNQESQSNSDVYDIPKHPPTPLHDLHKQQTTTNVENVYGAAWGGSPVSKPEDLKGVPKASRDVYEAAWEVCSGAQQTSTLQSEEIRPPTSTEYSVPRPLGIEPPPPYRQISTEPIPDVPPRRIAPLTRPLSMPEGPPPPVPFFSNGSKAEIPPKLPLRQRSSHGLSLKRSQTNRLLEEISRSSRRGLAVLVNTHDCQLALVDFVDSVWIAGWNQQKSPHLADGFHIGDRLLEINGTKIRSAEQAQKLIKLCTEKIRVVVQRCPYASVTCIEREAAGQGLGITCFEGTAQITQVHPGGLAARHGLESMARGLDGNPTHWWITEINNRPLNLFFSKKEIQYRLDAVGKDITIVAQPMDLMLGIRKQLKQLKSYKSFLLG